MNLKSIHIIGVFRVWIWVFAAVVLAVSCSSGEPAEPNEPAASAPQPSSGDLGDALVPQYDNYRLSYSSTCGDGPFFTDGTEIEVLAGVVSVISGEEPFTIGSLASWNEIAQAAASDGRLENVELSADGSLKSLEIIGRGIDDEFCVTVSAFKDLS